MPASMADVIAGLVREVMGEDAYAETAAEWLADPADED